MGFVSPFKKALESSNPLIKDAQRYIAEEKNPIAWTFSTIPSENWKNGVGAALTAYAEGRGSWDAVVTAFVNGWENEYKKTH